jgi:divalent metal cation (Fe/Co/Zn/Cd) transporter
MDLHAIVNAMITVKEGHDLAHKLKDRLHKELPELGHVLIHVEPEGGSDEKKKRDQIY